MCRNHSHMKAVIVGHDRHADIAVYILRVEQDLTIEMQNGVKLTLPSSSTLLLPVSMLDGSSALVQQPTGEQYTYLFSTTGGELIGIPIKPKTSPEP